MLNGCVFLNVDLPYPAIQNAAHAHLYAASATGQPLRLVSNTVN